MEIIVIGGGIMSATFATYMKLLEPNCIIHMYEKLSDVSEESSNFWNNSGTGHSAFCELNYTPITKTGKLDISKALEINESFEVSLQFWTFLVKKKILINPNKFINNVPHMSFVWGKDNIYFLKKRFNSLKKNSLFNGIVYSENIKEIRDWAPLLIDGRNPCQEIAATMMKMGTDVNFEEITKQLIENLKNQSGFYLNLNSKIIDIKRNKDKSWKIIILKRNKNNYLERSVQVANYLFIGSGGASIKLLQKSKISASKNYAGFPIGGQFLVSKNPIINEQHSVKVYGKASIGSPPMSIPHIDMRFLNKKKILIFGPFATFNSKFLKHGSYLDLIYSIRWSNIIPMLHVGLTNLSLLNYLVKQTFMSESSRFNFLKQYYPKAKKDDWFLVKAGQRVQIIQRKGKHSGILKFGTEIVSSKDGSLSVILGASPGASSSAEIILKVLNIMFKKKIFSKDWKEKLLNIIPSYGRKINNNFILTNNIRRYTCEILKLNFIESKEI